MAVFTINGKETDSFEEAVNMLRDIWSSVKEPFVSEQRKEALSKPTLLDVERAQAGVTPNMEHEAAARLAGQLSNGGGAATVS